MMSYRLTAYSVERQPQNKVVPGTAEYIKVLLIEDDPVDAHLIKEMLSEAKTVQFELIVANRLAAGLEQLSQTPIDLILSDLSLPDSQGLNTFSKIHQHAPNLPIVVLSGLNDQTLALKAVHEGAQDYLVKGEVDSKWLARSLCYAIERKRVEQAEQELIRMKDEFLGHISHQLRTPITSLKGFLKFLLEGKAKDPATEQEFLLRASQDANRLMMLVNDLLDQFRLEAIQFQLELDEEVNLHLLLKETLHALQGIAAQKGIQLIYTPSTTSLMVKANRYWLQQVVINLVSNAIKFSEGQRRVMITNEIANSRIKVKVIDQGPGIPAEAMPKLFNKFYQVSNQVTGNNHGTGLGLYISKGVIEAHGGWIGVESQVGQGSTFFFTLPELNAPRIRKLSKEMALAR